jgi:hypothetical protein
VARAAHVGDRRSSPVGESGEDFMERSTITIGLIAGHLIDQGDDTHPGERPD